MTPRIWLQSATFSDGTKVEFARDDIVVVVGGNNSGKSALLRAIDSRLGRADAPSPILKEQSFEREGSDSDIEAWLPQISEAYQGNRGKEYATIGGRIHHDFALTFWKHHVGLAGLAPFFCHMFDTETRLALVRPPENQPFTAAPTHPIHLIQFDSDIEKEVSDRFYRAFGVQLVLNRNAGSTVPLHCGAIPIRSPNEDRLSRTYARKIEQLPLLHEQGDGMRAFAAFVLYLWTTQKSILLIDEPEAFLHPPQIRELANLLSERIPRTTQVFVATHSADFVRAMLDATDERLRILRLTRKGDVNHVAELRGVQIRELWKDPILRYSNAIDSLFHQKTVVTEGDGDCRFYSAVLNSLPTSDADSGVMQCRDVLFTPCGGKSKMPTVVRALRALGLSLSVIVDFDALNDFDYLRRLFESLGCDWNCIVKDAKLVKESIDMKCAQLKVSDAKEKITAVLNSINESFVPTNAREEIKRILKQASPWAHAKEIGKGFVPPGDATRAFDRLETLLRSIGLFVVPLGELESFDRTVGGHGPPWVAAVLEKDLKAHAFDPARRFVLDVVGIDAQAERASEDGALRSNASPPAVAPVVQPNGI